MCTPDSPDVVRCPLYFVPTTLTQEKAEEAQIKMAKQNAQVFMGKAYEDSFNTGNFFVGISAFVPASCRLNSSYGFLSAMVHDLAGTHPGGRTIICRLQ
jgi:hypothetical protein